MESAQDKLVFRFESWGAGDVLCMTPVLERIRRDYPMSFIAVNTNWPDIFSNSPFVDGVYPDGTSHHDARKYTDLRLNFASRELIGKQAAQVCGTSLECYKPQIYLSDDEIKWGQDLLNSKNVAGRPVIGYAPLMSRTNWQGRNWTEAAAASLTRKLSDKKFFIVEMGKKVPSTGESHLDLVDRTTLRQMFAVISQCDYFIGIDSLPFHVAQAFEIPSLILFGAVDPNSRIVNSKTTKVVRNKELDCLGCYQVKGSMTQNQCNRGDEACMKFIDTCQVFDNFIKIVNGSN